MIKTTTTYPAIRSYAPFHLIGTPPNNSSQQHTSKYNAKINRYETEDNIRYHAENEKEVLTLTHCAGRTTGIYKINVIDSAEREIAINSPLLLITPEAGAFQTVDSLLTAFTSTEDPTESTEQKQHLITWLSHAARAIYNGEHTAAPTLVFIPQKKEPTAQFIVDHIITPILGNMCSDLAPYLHPSGWTGRKEIGAQCEQAAFLYAELGPETDFHESPGARVVHLESFFKRLAAPLTIHEHTFPGNIHHAKMAFKPIYRAALETYDMKHTNLMSAQNREGLCILHTYKPTLLQAEIALENLSVECRAQLPAFIHYLLNECTESQPEDYIAPSVLRKEQRARFNRNKGNNNATRAFYKIASILILAQDPTGPTKTLARDNTLSLFRDITKAAKEYNMPLPKEEWTPDNLKDILHECAHHYPAYIQTVGEGWIINLATIENEVML